MNLKVLIYSNFKTAWFAEDFDRIKKTLQFVEGLAVGAIDIDLVHFEDVPTFINEAGSRVVEWEWFKRNLTNNARMRGYNAACFLFSTGDKNQWGISNHVGGWYNDDSDDMFEFFIACTKNQKAEGYTDMSEFERLFLHELSHGITRWTVGEAKDYTHIWDHNLKAIDAAFRTYSFTAWNEKVSYREHLKRIIQSIKEKFMGKETLAFPLAKDLFLNKVTNPFGVRDKTYISGIHMGTDWGLPLETPLYAPCDGYVSKVFRRHISMGNAVFYTFKFKGTWYTARYLHLDSLLPAATNFKKGELLCFSGNTGKSNAPHFHHDIQIGSTFDFLRLYTEKQVLKYHKDPYAFYIENSGLF